MAKNFPYFKFIATEWMTGDIVFESFSTQGLFINICALYWQRNGQLSIDDINKRFKNPIELNELTDRFFSVNDGLICIKFLDEQLIDANHISKVNSENGSKGGRPKTLEKKPNANRPLTESKAKKSKEEKEEEIKKELELKKKEFLQAMTPYKNNYDAELLNDFYFYWTETKPNSKILRWEREKAFDMERRLSTWVRFKDKFKDNKTDKL
jgi:hypothetical protein